MNTPNKNLNSRKHVSLPILVFLVTVLVLHAVVYIDTCRRYFLEVLKKLYDLLELRLCTVLQINQYLYTALQTILTEALIFLFAGYLALSIYVLLKPEKEPSQDKNRR